ncbi:MAG: transcriptional repressor LexA [Alphaproteobacteria bacterium]|nr:transcriptional repressor LexA [Alphaproteobacteria bacterium]
MLTKKQYKLLMYIAEEQKKKGVSPSFEEMRDAMGLKSKSGIFRLLHALEERGFVHQLPFRARALEVLKVPSEMTEHPKIILPKPNTSSSVVDMEKTTIPLLGKIAAGTPIEAICIPEDYVDVPSQMMGRGEHYALTVEGDSMVNAGILNGDTVIIKRTEHAENGEIVVALVDGIEVTLKRFRRSGTSIALEPENPAYQTRILPADRVAVQGKLVGLMRNY